jgi:conjugal transfer ATP-binding protein TraC
MKKYAVNLVEDIMEPDIIGASNDEYANSFSMPKFSHFIQPIYYDNDTDIWTTSDNEYGIVFELIAPTRMGENTAKIISTLLDYIKNDATVTVQFIMFGSKDIMDTLNTWETVHHYRNCEIVGSAITHNKEFLASKLHNSITNSFQCTIRDNRILLTVKSKKLKKIQDFKYTIQNELMGTLLESPIGKNELPNLMNNHALKKIFYEILNPNHNLQEMPRYSKRVPFNKQTIALDTIVTTKWDSINCDGKEYVPLAHIDLPEYAHLSEFSLLLGEYVTNATNMSQFMDSYFITINLRPMSSAELQSIKSRKEVNQNLNSKGKKSKDDKSEAEYIVDKIESRSGAFKFDMNVIVGGDNKKHAMKNATTVKNFWNKANGGILLSKLSFKGSTSTFLASLPLGTTNEYWTIMDKYTQHFTDEVVQFLPLEIDNKGNGVHIPFISRRGQICFLDMFNTNSNQNGFIVATSGAGKSMLLNYITFLTYAKGGLTFIIDIGRSYENICHQLGGQWIEIDLENPISFNPFTNIKDHKEFIENKTFLINFIYMLGSNKNQEESEKQEKLISGKITSILEQLWDKFGNKLEVNHVKNAFDKEEDQRFKDFGMQLSIYSRGGAYEAFFNGECNVSFENEFIVTELGSVENDADIRDPLIYLVIYNITNTVYCHKKDPSKRALLVIDEAHKFLGKNYVMDNMVDNAYRRFRKHNGSIFIATQSFEDIYTNGELNKIGKSIISNCTYRFFLKQTEESINALIQSKIFSFSKLDEELLRSVHTTKGEYSEFFLLDNSGNAPKKTVLRLVIDSYFYYLASTDSSDKDTIKKIQNQFNCSVAEAIKIHLGEG